MKSEPHIYAMHCDMAFSGVTCVKPKLHIVCTCMFPVAEVRLARGLGGISTAHPQRNRYTSLSMCVCVCAGVCAHMCTCV